MPPGIIDVAKERDIQQTFGRNRNYSMVDHGESRPITLISKYIWLQLTEVQFPMFFLVPNSVDAWP